MGQIKTTVTATVTQQHIKMLLLLLLLFATAGHLKTGHQPPRCHNNGRRIHTTNIHKYFSNSNLKEELDDTLLPLIKIMTFLFKKLKKMYCFGL